MKSETRVSSLIYLSLGAVLCILGIMPFNAGAADFHPDRILVRFNNPVQAQSGQLNSELASLGVRMAREFRHAGVTVLERTDRSRSLESLITRLQNSGVVAYAEPDYVYSIDQTIPSEGPEARNLWGLHNVGQTGGTPDVDIDAPEAWDYFTGTETVVVAVIDSGIDYTHPDLVDNLWVNPGEIIGNHIDDDGNGYVDDIVGINAILGNGNITDDNEHGTHVSGTIGGQGNNSIGVVGVNWDVEIMSCKFLDSSGSGFTSDAIECLNYLIMMKQQYGINIVASNNSWGGGSFSQSLYNAIDAAGNAGMLFVAAAGNSGANTDLNPEYPGSYDLPEIVSVASIDHNDNRSGFSNYGATSVDLGAPGSAIWSTIPGGGYASFNGTSMATPYVTGTAALLWGYFPNATISQMKRALLEGTVPTPALNGITVSGGRLNVLKAGLRLNQLLP